MRIISIEDTRDKMEIVDANGRERLVGIPGTGIAKPCDLCGTLHEIHVTVETEDKTIMVVGEGCGRKNWSAFASAISLYKAETEFATMAQPYTLIKKGFHPGYCQFIVEVSIEGKNHAIATRTEKDAVMCVVKRYFPARKSEFSAYFRAKSRLAKLAA